MSKGEIVLRFVNRMEALILYFVLFFPRVTNLPFSAMIPLAETISFSILRELSRTLTYTIPSLALIWYLISDKKGFTAIKTEKPRMRDVYSFAAGLPGLILAGLGISLLVMLFQKYHGLVPPPKVEAPVNVTGWIVMVFSCLGTGYLEESYFRYYLLKTLEKSLPNAVFRIILSTVLFSLCHMYEGPWGILNAVLAGILLSLLFIRFKSLHGIAWAHGAYNIFVYAMGSFGSSIM